MNSSIKSIVARLVIGCWLLAIMQSAAGQKQPAESAEDTAKVIAAAKEHLTFAPRAAWQLQRCLSPALSPQLDTLAYVNQQEIVIRDLRSGDVRHTNPLGGKQGEGQQGDFVWLTYIDNGATLLVSFTSGELQFFDVAKGTRTRKLDVISENETLRWQATFDKDQQIFTISGSYEEKATFAIHNLKTGAKGKTFQRVTPRYGGKFALSNDGKKIALSQEDKNIAVVEINNPTKPLGLEAKAHDTSAMAFSPDDKQLITVKEGREGLFRVWDLAQGKVVKEQKSRLSTVSELFFARDNKLLCAAGSEQCLFDAATLEPRGSFPGGGSPRTLVISADGNLAATLHQEHNDVQFLRLSDLVKPAASVIHRRTVTDDALLSASGKFLVIPLKDAWSVVDTTNWQEQFQIPERYVHKAFAPDADVIAWTHEEKIHFRDLTQKKDLPSVPMGGHYVADLQFTSDGKQLYGQTGDGLVMWDRATGKLVYGLRGAASKRHGPLAISPDRKWLAFAGEGGMVEIWDMATRARAHKFVAHDYNVQQLVFSRDSRALATAGDDTVRLWSAMHGKLVHELRLISSDCRQLWFPENGTSLMTVDSSGLVQHWDWRRAQLLDVIPSAIPEVNRAFLAPGSGALLTRHTPDDDPGYLQLWNTADLLKPATYQQSPLVKHKVESYRHPVNELLPMLARVPPGNGYELNLPDLVHSAWSPTQPHFVLGRRDGSLTLYDAGTVSEIRQLPHAPGKLQGFAFTPDGQDLLIAAGATLQRLKVADGKVVWSVKNDRPFKSDVFAPDGKQIITSASDDKTGQTKFWDTANGKVLQKIEKEAYLMSEVEGVTAGGLLIVGKYNPGWMKPNDMQPTTPQLSLVTLQAQPKGELLVGLGSQDEDRRVVVIDPAKNAVVAEIPVAFKNAFHLFFAPDGKHVYLGSGNSGLGCVDLQAKRELFHIDGGPGMTHGSISADGRFLLGHSTSSQAYLYDLQPLADPAQAKLLSQFGSYAPYECTYLPALPGVSFQPLHLGRKVYGRDTYLKLGQLSQLTNLASLDLEGGPLDDETAAKIGACRELRKLRFVGSQYLTAAGLQSLAQLAHLEELELGAATLTDDAIGHLAKLPKLRRLVLRGPKLTATAATELAKFPALTEIGWTGEDIDGAIITALAKVPQLTALEISNASAEPGALAPLAAAPKLRRLKFVQNEVDGAELLPIKQLTAVEFLNVSLTSIDQLAQLPQLAELSVQECEVNYNQFAALQQAKQLKKFEFAFGYAEKNDGLEKLAGLPGPKKLRLPSSLKPDQVAGIAGWTAIEELTLTGNDTDETLQHLAGLKNLRVLHFNEYNSSPLTGSGLAHLATCTKLTELNLKGQKLTSEGIAGIAGLTQLTSLTLPQADDQSIVHLAKLTKLRQLTLLGGGEKKLTDAAAATLLKLTELTHLDLGHTDLQAAGIEKLTALKKLENLKLPFSLPYADREALQKKLALALPDTYVH